MKYKILFVDDEKRILDGLKRLLYSERHNWDTTFVLSADEALELVKKEKFDAIVSDMKMPKMDGAKLLREVRRFNPNIVRIILSGYSDMEMAIRSVGITHQYLSKPCKLDELKTVLSGAFALRDILTDEKLRDTINGLENIPSIPSAFKELVELVKSGNLNARQISDVISEDPPMVARLLQLANSAFFGSGHHISSPSEAVLYLGIGVISAVVLTDGIFTEFSPLCEQIEDFSLETLWHHSVAVGNLAGEIAKAENADAFVIDCSHAAGILRDIGLVILVCNLREDWRRIVALMKNGLSIGEAEDQILGTRHERLGAYLLGLWGLPDEIVQAISFYYEPDNFPHTQFNSITALHAAGAICDKTKVDTEYLKRLSVDHRVETWQASYGRHTEKKS